MINYQVSLTTKLSASKLKKAFGKSILAIEPEDYNRAEIAELKKAGYTILGYLSIGSVSDERSYYKTLKKYRLKSLDDWPHEWYLDLRRSAVRDWCVKRATEIKAMGFDGWWLDNLDIYEEYKSTTMYSAIISVLGRIKALGGYVMINGGSAFLQKFMDNDTGSHLYKVQLGAYDVKENAEKTLDTAREKKIDAAMIQSSTKYRVQAGAFSVKSNAEKMLVKVIAAGFKDAFIVDEDTRNSRGYIDGVTQEEVFSLIKDYSGNGRFSSQETKQSAWYQNHLCRCIRHNLDAFLLEYTKDNVLKLRIKAFCSAKGMTGCCISVDVNL